jgi:hypothetical protein
MRHWPVATVFIFTTAVILAPPARAQRKPLTQDQVQGLAGGSAMQGILKTAAGVVAFAAFLSVPGNAQESWGAVFHNERVKTITYPDRPIDASSRHVTIEGIWVSESKEPSKALVFPQQVRINCLTYGSDEKRCTEITLTLAPAKGVVGIGYIDTREWDIDTSDAHGLVASYGGDDISDKCQRHVLTIAFESGAVSVADIPTHKRGCDAFEETNSYRLVRGHYYVGITPNNDWDRPAKVGNK